MVSEDYVEKIACAERWINLFYDQTSDLNILTVVYSGKILFQYQHRDSHVVVAHKIQKHLLS